MKVKKYNTYNPFTAEKYPLFTIFPHYANSIRDNIVIYKWLGYFWKITLKED